MRLLAPVFGGDVVNVSGGTDQDKQGSHYRDYFSAAASYSITNYGPDTFRGFEGRDGEILLDLEGELSSELHGRFDVALSHTVLEHVFELRRAFRNLCLLTRDVAVVCVPVAQVQHESKDFGDYWRFMPGGLRRLFAENEMTVIYEAVNNDPDAATYLISVGARNPETWKGRMPEWSPVHKAADWIGRMPPPAGIRQLIRDRIIRLWSGSK